MTAKGDTCTWCCAAAESIGVTAEPEVASGRISGDTPFIVIASDGVFEFMQNQTVINMVRAPHQPQLACCHAMTAAVLCFPALLMKRVKPAFDQYADVQVDKYKDPQQAAIALVVEAYRLWLQYETRTDDITAVVIHIKDIEPNGDVASKLPP